ncbi:MAG: LysM peptidoglycan-binding domain-containing protein [Gammaproteobacteria bacterium]
MRAAQDAVRATTAAPLAEARSETPRRPVADTPTDDTWDRLRSRFSFADVDNADVARERQWYRDHPRYLREVATRARPYLHHIANELERRDLPGELALLPILESGYRSDTASPYGAAGLWQFMGGTGSKFGLDIDRWYDGRMDVVRSTNAALNYLTALQERFDGDWLMAVAAYNAGWGNLEKTIATQRRLGRRTGFWSLPVQRETRSLVARLVALADVFAAPAQYGLTLEPLPDRPYFEVVTLEAPTDLRRFRSALGAPAHEFFQLNAAWRAAHTPRAGAAVYVPIGLREQAQALASKGIGRAEPPSRLAVAARDAGGRRSGSPAGRTHRVRSGDSLWTVAARHDLSVRELAAANGLPLRTTLKIGQTLRIPGRGGHAAPAPKGSHAAAGARTVRYKVRSGDSLWTISRQFKVTVQQLVAWNGLGRKQQLQPGQELLVHRQS